MPISPDRFIYLVRAGENHYKVGIAQDVMHRLKGIQTGNPKTIELIVAMYIPDAQSVERQLHKWLSSFKADGGREWFELDPENALRLIKKITSLTITADISKYLELRNLITRQTLLEEKVEAYFNKPEVIKKIEDAKEEELRLDYDEDKLFDEAVKVVRFANKASASMLQRRMRVGYARAARLLDQLEKSGVIGPGDGARPREVLPYSSSLLER
jgi:DNA segregation ATPase FtsK/SpoIIIE-like protein